MSPFDFGLWMCGALDLQVGRGAAEGSYSVQWDRSRLLRSRLHQVSCESPAAGTLERPHPCRGGYSTLSIPMLLFPAASGPDIHLGRLPSSRSPKEKRECPQESTIWR